MEIVKTGEVKITQAAKSRYLKRGGLRKIMRSVGTNYLVLNDPTRCIQVAGLKLPFTIIELRELMEGFGKFDRCWTNRAQTHCMVEFLEESSAQKACKVLRNMEWPSGSGNKLISDYIEPERMNELISRKEVPRDLEDKLAVMRGEKVPSPAKPAPASLLKKQIKKQPVQQTEERGTALEKIFSKTKAKPQVYYRLWSEEEVSAGLGKRKIVD